MALELKIAWSMMAVRIWSLQISACPEAVGRLFVEFRMIERRWRFTDNIAFDGMNNWNIVASSEGRKADRMSPMKADGDPYPFKIS